MISELQEGFNKLKLEMEVIESWLRIYDFDHAEIVYDTDRFLAQTLLPKPRYGEGKTMIEAVMNWKAKHE
jgi:hypothetical protein